ncbi:MAG: ShlB/FhaC/HecB family hemolysin secretion/activation protein [Leptolyngbyaceae cyanobacterium bins.302]|nr:ShlB/FhaC/HecB family hemolysin secretion/activation protein [Leptolyngbyaceae cyanobacterium bins.302]
MILSRFSAFKVPDCSYSDRVMKLRFWCGIAVSGTLAIGGGSQIPTAIATPAGKPFTSFPSASSESLLMAQVPDPSRTGSPDPNRDRLIQPSPAPTPLPTTPPVIPVQPAPSPTPAPASEPSPEVKVSVSRVEVIGSSIFNPKDFEPITKPLEGRENTLEQLRQAADAITQLYLDRGYITSRAVLVDQTIQNGVVQIQVIEGSIEDIVVEGTQNVRQSYVRSRVGLGAKAPLNRDDLEDSLRLLKTDPLFTNVEASLRPGTQLGKSLLIVRVTEAKQLSGIVGVDNYSPPSVGAVRLGGSVLYRNLTGFGDEIGFSVFHTTPGGADNLDLFYRVPVNPLNGSVQFRFAPSWNRVIDPAFEELDIKGRSQLYDFSFRQPLFRNPRREFALSLGFAAQNGQTFLFDSFPFPFGIGPDEEGNSRTRVLKFGQDYIKRDPFGAWALRSQFNFGIDIFDATVNEDPIPDGRFFSWLAQVQRVQRLGNNHLLILQGDLQLTPDTLLPSQQFVIGGGQSVRGFRQNARSGDNGFRISIEDRITLVRDEGGIAIFQIAPFIDFGKVWNTPGNPNPQPEQRFLAGGGFAILWQPYPGLNIRADYGPPFLRLRDRGNDAQDAGFYFSVGYQF